MPPRRLAALLLAAFAAVPLSAACRIAKLAELPIRMRDLRPLTDLTLNGRPMQLMVDSGAFYSMLTPSSATELALPLRPLPAGFTVSGVGGEITPMVGTVRDLGISGATLHRVEFIVGGNEVGAAGLLGQNFLGLRDAEYDLAAGVVRLMEAKDCTNTNLAYWAKPAEVSVIPILDPQGQAVGGNALHIVGTVKVNGVPMQAIFDTGAPTTILTTRAAARAGIRVGDAGVEDRGTSRGGIGRRASHYWVATVRSVDFGGEEIRNTRLSLGQMGEMPWDMLVGADFFLSHHVYVANSVHRMFVTYNGGRVFHLDEMPTGDTAAAVGPAPTDPAAPTRPVAGERAAAVAAAATPTDADGFARRGAARLERHDAPGALADLDEAIRRAPDDPRYLVDRARLRLMQRQPLLAGNDLDVALRLQPDAPKVRVMRAGLRLRMNDRVGARDDADAAAALLSRQDHLHLELAGLYVALDRFAEAIAQDGLWLASHPADAERPTVFNNRCWARALANQELDQALADCNAALRGGREAGVLDSRGLVYLRRGELERAIADYDAALAGQAGLAWSRWGRGLARIAKGDATAGRADLAAAAAIDAGLPERARRYGLGAPS